MSTHTYPIVGMYYQPERGSPAPAFIKALSVGAKLLIRAEPENPVDPQAVAVWLRSEDIPEICHDSLDMHLKGFGMTIEDILHQESWQLGYLPAPLAAKLRLIGAVPLDTDIEGELTFSPAGKPMFNFEDKV